jgi:hypothetical protein
VLDCGKHKDERWTRIPLSYLTWVLNEMAESLTNANPIAKAELEGRFHAY